MSSKKQMHQTGFLPTKSYFLIELYKCLLEVIGPSSAQKLITKLANFSIPNIYEPRDHVVHEYQLHDLVIAKLEKIKGVNAISDLYSFTWGGRKYCLNVESEMLPHYEHHKILEEIKKIPGIEYVAALIPQY